MAHWDEERDKRYVEMMRKCNRPDLEPIIRKYEETGDLIYWSAFVDRLRADLEQKTAQFITS